MIVVVICRCSMSRERDDQFMLLLLLSTAVLGNLISSLICYAMLFYAKMNWTTFLFSLSFFNWFSGNMVYIRSKQLKSLQKDIMPFSLLWDHPFTFCAHIKFYSIVLFSSISLLPLPSNSNFIRYFSFF